MRVVALQARELMCSGDSESDSQVLSSLPVENIYLLRTSTWGRCLQELIHVVEGKCGGIIITDLQHAESYLHHITRAEHNYCKDTSLIPANSYLLWPASSITPKIW